MIIHPAIKLRHLRLFLQIAESGSLTAAAAVLRLSQPAMSQSLAELEQLLGGDLFLRQGRKLVLTSQGETVRTRANEALACLDAAALSFKDGTPLDRIVVGALPTVSTSLFPQVVRRYLERRNAETLAVETGPHPYLLQRLRARDIDFMVGRMPQAFELERLHFELLYEEPIVAVVRASHPLHRESLHNVIATSPLILPTRDAIIRQTVDQYLTSLGHNAAKPAVETSTLALGRGILTETDAVWFISRSVVADEISRGILAPINLGASYLSGAVGITTVADAKHHASVLQLIEIIRDVAKIGAKTGAKTGNERDINA